MVCCRRGGGGTPSKEQCRQLYPITEQDCVDGGLCPDPPDPTKAQCRELYPITYEESRQAWPVTDQECVDGGHCPEPLDGPTDLDLVSSTDTSATFTMNTVDDATEYILSKRVRIPANPIPITVTDGCPAAGTRYEYEATAVVGGVETGPSNVVVWIPPDTPPPEPNPVTNFTAATTPGVYEVRLSWDHDGLRVTHFWIERRRSSETQWRTVTRQLAAGARTFTDGSGLSVSVEYQYRIRAVGDGGESDPVTLTVTIPPPSTIPVPVIGAKTNNTTSSITTNLLYQDDYRPLLQGFVVQVSEEGAGWSEADGPWQTDPTVTEITLNDLTANLHYRIRAAAKDADGTLSAWSVVRDYATAPSALVVPQNLFVEGMHQTEADLHWDGDPGASGYFVELTRNGQFVASQQTANTWIVLPLQPGGNYTATVKSTRGEDQSDPASVSFSTAAATPQPIALMVTNVYIDNWNVRVRWSDPVAGAAYLVVLTKVGDTEPTRTRYGCSGEAGITLPDIPGGTYTVQVRTEVSETRKSAWTVKQGHVVPNTPP